MKYTKIIIIIVLLAVFIITFICYNNSKVDNKWSIVANSQIGQLKKDDLNSDNVISKIYDVFGFENVETNVYYIGEEWSKDSLVVYKDSPNELVIIIDDQDITFIIPGYNSYYIKNYEKSKDIMWQMEDDIQIGMSIRSVQEINGKVFSLTGFEWDYPGTTTSWNNGNISDNIALSFIQTSEIISEEYYKITGDDRINSDNLTLNLINPIVNLIFIKWEIEKRT